VENNLDVLHGEKPLLLWTGNNNNFKNLTKMFFLLIVTCQLHALIVVGLLHVTERELLMSAGVQERLPSYEQKASSAQHASFMATRPTLKS
jgi:hypothetical protein